MFYPEDGSSAILRNVGGCYEPAQRDMAEGSLLCFIGYDRAVHVARMGEGRVVYRVCGGTEGKRPLERPTSRWEDNINMFIQEVGCGVMDWIELAQHRDMWRHL
jgi:hypothetical protein